MSAITSDAVSAMHAVAATATGYRSFSVRALGEWQVEALKKLARFGLLPMNWDSYGSPPISDDVLEATAELVSGVSLQRVPDFAMTPVSGGGVQMEWEKGDRKLILEVHPDITFDVLIAEGDESRELLLPSLRSRAIEGLLSWVDAQ